MTETLAGTSQSHRYLTTLVKQRDGRWRVLALDRLVTGQVTTFPRKAP